MRLDMFLKTSRLVKRRPLANELCDAGRVVINGSVARAAHVVRPGDVLELHEERVVRKLRVLAVPEGQQTKVQAARLYELLGQEPSRIVTLAPRPSGEA